MSTLILIRHGQSEWNLANLFTGWVDADLTDQGVAEATAGGATLAEAGLAPDVVHTSLQIRAIRTADLALQALGRSWVPVRRSWRLNERHYGALTGQDKAEATAEHGADQVHIWRRSYDTPPPPMPEGHEHDPAADARYADLAPEQVPRAECLADVVERMLPYWYDGIVPDLRADRCVLVAAHGNSLRALVKHLDDIGHDDIASINLPTGVPIRYDLDDSLRPTEAKHPLERCLGDADAIASAADAVANQGNR